MLIRRIKQSAQIIPNCFGSLDNFYVTEVHGIQYPADRGLENKLQAMFYFVRLQ